MTEGNVFKIQRYCINDGPGIRTTVFLKGCPLSCLWCHNPEGQVLEPQLIYNEKLCTMCRACENTCSRGIHEFKENRHIVKFENLSSGDDILKCERVCPTKALTVAGKKVSAEEVIEEVKRDKGYYDESGGGMTLSGGDPLFQPSFTEQLIALAKANGIATYIETCGYAEEEIFKKTVKQAEGILYDLKVIDNNKHLEYTGKSNALILKNFKNILSLNIDVIVRIPLISGITDTSENIQDICRFLNETGFKGSIELMPYNTFGIVKYKRIGWEYKLPNLKKQTDEGLKRISDLFQKNGIAVIVN